MEKYTIIDALMAYGLLSGYLFLLVFCYMSFDPM